MVTKFRRAWFLVPVGAALLIAVALLTRTILVTQMVPRFTPKSPAPLDHTLNAERITVSYSGISEAAARKVAAVAQELIGELDLFAEGVAGISRPDTVRLSVRPSSFWVQGPQSYVVVHGPPDRWEPSRQEVARTTVFQYLKGTRPGLATDGFPFWVDGLAALLDSQESLPMNGYTRPDDPATFRMDLRDFVAALGRAGELGIRRPSDLIPVTVRDNLSPARRFYRQQAAAFIASVIDRYGAQGFFDNYDRGLRRPNGQVDQSGLGSLMAEFSAWLDKGDSDRFFADVTRETRTAQFRIWLLVMLGLSLAGALLLAAAGIRRHLPGDECRKSDLLTVLGILGFLVALGAIEFWVGILPMPEILRHLYSLAVIAIALHAIAQKLKAKSAGGGAISPRLPDSWARSLAIVSCLYLVSMAVRFGVYAEDQRIFGKGSMMVLALLWVVFYERLPLRAIGLNWRRFWPQIALGVLALVLYRLSNALTSATTYALFGQRMGGWSFIWGVLGDKVQPALRILHLSYGNLAEEVLFRGYVLYKLTRVARSKAGLAVAIAAQSLLFGLIHVNYDSFPFNPIMMVFYIIDATTFGIAMTMIARTTGSVTTAAVAHVLSNLGVFFIGTRLQPNVHWVIFDVVWYVLRAAFFVLILPPALRLAMSLSGQRDFRLAPADANQVEVEERRRAWRTLGYGVLALGLVGAVSLLVWAPTPWARLEALCLVVFVSAAGFWIWYDHAAKRLLELSSADEPDRATGADAVGARDTSGDADGVDGAAERWVEVGRSGLVSTLRLEAVSPAAQKRRRLLGANSIVEVACGTLVAVSLVAGMLVVSADEPWRHYAAASTETSLPSALRPPPAKDAPAIVRKWTLSESYPQDLWTASFRGEVWLWTPQDDSAAVVVANAAPEYTALLVYEPRGEVWKAYNEPLPAKAGLRTSKDLKDIYELAYELTGREGNPTTFVRIPRTATAAEELKKSSGMASDRPALSLPQHVSLDPDRPETIVTTLPNTQFEVTLRSVMGFVTVTFTQTRK